MVHFYLFFSVAMDFYLKIMFFILPFYIGQPKRHLLTTGWSMFVGAKMLRAGDSVLFIRYSHSNLIK